MEDYLGLKLFERVKQRLLLTEAGRSYVSDVRKALDQIQAATLNLLAHQGQGGDLILATASVTSDSGNAPQFEPATATPNFSSM